MPSNTNSATSLLFFLKQAKLEAYTIPIRIPKDLSELQSLCKFQPLYVCPEMNLKAMPNPEKAMSIAVKKIFKYMCSFIIIVILS